MGTSSEKNRVVGPHKDSYGEERKTPEKIPRAERENINEKKAKNGDKIPCRFPEEHSRFPTLITSSMRYPRTTRRQAQGRELLDKSRTLSGTSFRHRARHIGDPREISEIQESHTSSSR